MGTLLPLADCLARPDENGRRSLLVDHLVATADACGNAFGDPADRLGFLAGLLHDAGKCQSDWQDYIRGGCTKGPAHAPLGAALFAFCCDSLIDGWTDDRSERRQLRDAALDWTRAVYDHHGRLDDLDTVAPWDTSSPGAAQEGVLAQCDSVGIFALVASFFPGFAAAESQFGEWMDAFDPRWRRRVQFERDRLLRQADPNENEAPGLRLPAVASRLVCADRYHAGGFARAPLTPKVGETALAHLAKRCCQRAQEALAGGADPALVEQRTTIQQTAAEAYHRNADATFFTLLLPTGYGKTLTSLRVGLEACRSGRANRLVYVAPYLSILSQGSGEIARATGVDVFQHHHLTLAELTDDEDVEVLDSWQAPILATTFNQLFRALFPKRAQECVRIEALRGAFLIVDEPQIVDTAAWNLFLRALEIASKDWGCRVLFATATLPALTGGLKAAPIALAPRVASAGRYRLRYECAPLNAAEVADRVGLLAEEGESVAVVLNTVRDAVQVYRHVADRGETASLHCLTAMMLPGHKAQTIRALRDELTAGEPVVAVCTQILEAGVDLSFRHILRALPLFPSIAQVAGRANRHGEGAPATVTVFPFVRQDVDTRRYVYRDETARRQTDALLDAHPDVAEEEIGELLDVYFNRCSDENRQTALLRTFDDAARGKWSELAGLDPFGGSGPRTSVFVPTACAALGPAMERLQARFAPNGPDQLLENYLTPAFRRELDFLDRKRFLALLQQYVVPLSPAAAQAQPACEQATPWLWRLTDSDLYASATGLAHLLVEEDSEDSSLII